MATTATALHKRTFKRKTRDGYLVVTAQLTCFEGQAPYFSVTSDLWKSEGWYRNGADHALIACGRLNDETLRAFPKLAPLVALHLSDIDGVPTYPVENGWYWYSDYDGKGAGPNDSGRTPRGRAARYLRVDFFDLPSGLTKPEFAEFVETLRPRWKAEADAALAFLQEGGS